MKPLKMNIHDLIMVLEHLRDKEGIEELILLEFGETMAIADAEDPGQVLVSFDSTMEGGIDTSQIH